ncbi:MAG: biopolymer transporter ExbD [Lachnospiraceae bacterium]|nr:biopolymer transporter ExbD [Lachnospiraceae bacterium]
MRRRKRRGDALIDLTSLLDVVFIMLLIVVCSQMELGRELRDKEQTVSSAMIQARAASENAARKEKQLDDLLDASGDIYAYVPRLSILADYDPEAVTERSISVLAMDGAGKDEFQTDLSGNDGTKERFGELRKYLAEYLESHPDRPVVISFNEDDRDVLYRDLKMILEILDEIGEEYPKVSIRYPEGYGQ